MNSSGRALGAGCLLLALGVAANSILGPLLTGVIDYRYTQTFENQGIGLDAFALVFAVPLLLAAGYLARRDHLAAPFLALAPALMTAYMMPQYILGAHYGELQGNNEDFFLLQLGLFVLSGVVAVLAWTSVRPQDLPVQTPRGRKWTAALLFLMAAFLILRYTPALGAIWAGDPPREYVEDPIAFWVIALLDLGIVMPAAVACAFGVLKGQAASQPLMYTIVGWFALVGPAVAAMGIAMVINDDPHASEASAVAFAIYGGVFALLAGYIYRPLFRGRRESPTPPYAGFATLRR